MSSTSPVRNLPFDDTYTAADGPAGIDRRTKPSGLVELSAGFVTFETAGSTDPWTLPYEEVFYVIDGELTIHCDGAAVVGRPGDVLTLEKGITVVYEGAAGTRVFFSLVPANWLELRDQA
ncbi:MAG: cupin domain-containing protein [Nocardioidaceae bacterium]